MKPNPISVRGASYAKLATLDKLPLTHDLERRSRTNNCAATRRLTASCKGVLRRSAACVTYSRSRQSNPSKDCLTPSKTRMRCLFLALSRLCQALPGLYRCEPHKLPPQRIIQILVAEYLHKCIRFLCGSMERLGQISRLLCSQRVEETASGARREASTHRPRKKSQYPSLGELMESKTKLLDQMLRRILKVSGG
jgi:hypothetical protein